MVESHRIVVLTSCTGTKATLAAHQRVAAEDLYAGEQHRRLMRGVREFRGAALELDLDLWILSAGHGLVSAHERLSTYDTSFAGLRRAALDEQAAKLGVPDDVARLLARPAALTVLLLGSDYLRAASFPPANLASPILAFCGQHAGSRLESIEGIRAVPTTKRETQRFACGLVGLKGELGARLLQGLAREPSRLADLTKPSFDIVHWLEAATSDNRQLGLAA